MFNQSETISDAPSSYSAESRPVVFVIDDDPSVRESLESMIQCAGWQVTVFASAKDFLAHPRMRTPNCLVLDVTLPDLSGLELQRLISDRTELPIIFITGFPDVPTTVQAMKAGAVEFLTKPFNDQVLLNAIQEALEDSRNALSRETDTETWRARYASLSRREREVMALVVSGLLNKQVGSELGISEITVKAHRGNVMRKMEAGSLPDLVRIAARLGVAAAFIKPARRTVNHCPSVAPCPRAWREAVGSM